MKHTLGIAELYTSSNLQDELITHSLGSCLGVTIYDKKLNVGGMLHALLPLSKNDKSKADKNPAMFSDTGMQELLTQMYQLGSKKEDLIVKVAGCASPLDIEGKFKIGERNYAVFRKILWRNNILIAGEDVGGKNPRTLMLNIQTGETTIASLGQKSII